MRWQKQWDENHTTAAWTKQLIPRLAPWSNVDYYTAQFLTGHGQFCACTKRFAITIDDLCPLCGTVDTAEYPIYTSARWTTSRRHLRTKLNLTSKNIIPTVPEQKKTGIT
ncbi:hypothetical protein Trydic_g1361 [Trypoxylus dichotomus]